MNFLGSTPHGTMPGGLLSRICLWHDAKLVFFASNGFIVGAAAQAALSESHTFYQSNRIGCWRSVPGEAAPAADSMRLSNFVFFLGLLGRRGNQKIFILGCWLEEHWSMWSHTSGLMNSWSVNRTFVETEGSQFYAKRSIAICYTKTVLKEHLVGCFEVSPKYNDFLISNAFYQ